MSDATDAHDDRCENRGTGRRPAAFDEFSNARERYLERMRVEAEIHRLETCWRLSREMDGEEASAGG